MFITNYVLCVTCHLAPVMCHQSCFTCHMSTFLYLYILKNKLDIVVELVGGGSVINGATLSSLVILSPPSSQLVLLIWVKLSENKYSGIIWFLVLEIIFGWDGKLDRCRWLPKIILWLIVHYENYTFTRHSVARDVLRKVLYIFDNLIITPMIIIQILWDISMPRPLKFHILKLYDCFKGYYGCMK